METKTEISVFCLTDVNVSPNLSDAALEAVAMDIAKLPEFPSRLSDFTRIAFSRACFTLFCRSGQGSYNGFDDPKGHSDEEPANGRESMHAVWQSYLAYFCPVEDIRVQLAARLGTADELSIEQLESVDSVPMAEPPLEPVAATPLSDAIPQQHPYLSEASREVAIVQARSKVVAAYNNLP